MDKSIILTIDQKTLDLYTNLTTYTDECVKTKVEGIRKILGKNK